MDLEQGCAGQTAMRLTDLDPNWATTTEGRTGMGIVFQCPCRPDCSTHLGVWFANPIDDGGPAAPEGDTFETLTLEPSVDASSSGHWHGHIKNGEIDPPDPRLA